MWGGGGVHVTIVCIFVLKYSVWNHCLCLSGEYAKIWIEILSDMEKVFVGVYFFNEIDILV